MRNEKKELIIHLYFITLKQAAQFSDIQKAENTKFLSKTVRTVHYHVDCAYLNLHHIDLIVYPKFLTQKNMNLGETIRMTQQGLHFAFESTFS